jgi:hypothetical protein
VALNEPVFVPGMAGVQLAPLFVLTYKSGVDCVSYVSPATIQVALLPPMHVVDKNFAVSVIVVTELHAPPPLLLTKITGLLVPFCPTAVQTAVEPLPVQLVE